MMMETEIKPEEVIQKEIEGKFEILLYQGFLVFFGVEHGQIAVK